MNYYQFHIADWALHTSHLSVVEDGIYRRLLDYYYDTEAPIKAEKTDRVIRRLRLTGYEETVASILEEFFVLRDGCWHNLRADDEISAYNAKAETARNNGRRGGRPKKNKDLEKKNRQETQPVISGNPAETGSKANHKPRTINQEPKKTPASAGDVPPKYTRADFMFAERMYEQVLLVAPKTKKPNLNKWADDIRLMRERDGYELDEIVELFDWANGHHFWATNILSPGKLREQYAKLDSQKRGIRNGSSETGNSTDRSEVGKVRQLSVERAKKREQATT